MPWRTRGYGARAVAPQRRRTRRPPARRRRHPAAPPIAAGEQRRLAPAGEDEVQRAGPQRCAEDRPSSSTSQGRSRGRRPGGRAACRRGRGSDCAAPRPRAAAARARSRNSAAWASWTTSTRESTHSECISRLGNAYAKPLSRRGGPRARDQCRHAAPLGPGRQDPRRARLREPARRPRERGRAAPRAGGDETLSARNRFRGISARSSWTACSLEIEIDVTEPSRVVAIVTRESVESSG